MSARVKLERSGDWAIGVAGVGHLTLSVDGAVVVDAVTTLDSDDPSTADAIPPLRADTTRVVDLIARRGFESGNIFGCIRQVGLFRRSRRNAAPGTSLAALTAC